MGKYKEVNKELIELVAQRKSGKEISEILNLNYSTVHRKLRKLGINLPNYHNKLKFDNTVFDVIDTEEKAYWLGFLFADGYVSSTRNQVELSLKGDDIEHLNKFSIFLNNRNKITTSIVKTNNKEYSRCRCSLINKHFHDNLISLGCIPNKSLTLQFPNPNIFQNQNLIRHFIRGYVDGDGCLTISSSGRLVLCIIGTQEFLDVINSYLPVKAKTKHKDKRRLNSNTFSISFCANNADLNAEYLYKDATIYLQRKYDRFAVLSRNT